MPERAAGRSAGRDALAVVVTGGIGAGKSAFCRALAGLPGVRVLDADEVVRRLLAEDAEVREQVGARFGPAVMGAEGRIDRARLAEAVFRDAGERRALEAILHPRVREELAEAVRALREAEGVAIVVVQVPLLAETGRPPWCDSVVTIEADEETRLRRGVLGGGDADDLRRRMAAQAGPAQRRAVADHVVANEGDLAHLEREARRLYETWRRTEEG
jgi:dephospho-CoA kinase